MNHSTALPRQSCSSHSSITSNRKSSWYQSCKNPNRANGSPMTAPRFVPSGKRSSQSASISSVAQLSGTFDLEKPFHLNSSVTRNRKRVRFGEARVIHSIWLADDGNSGSTNTPSSSSNDQWYTHKELSQFKRDAKRQCRRAWCEEVNGADDLYPESLWFSVQRRNDDVPGHSDELTLLANSIVRTEHFHKYRGLEHLSSRKLSLARGMTVMHATTEILIEQVNVKVLGQLRANPEEFLARIYADTTRPAGQYARMIGLADAAAAGYDPDGQIERLASKIPRT